MKTLPIIAIVAAVLVSPLRSFGTGMGPQPLPIDRLVASAEAVRAANPASPEAHYTLARIHYLAFAYSTRDVYAFGGLGANRDATRPIESWQSPPGLRSPVRGLDAGRLTEQEMGGAQPTPRGNPAAFAAWQVASAGNEFALRLESSRQFMQERWNSSEAISDDEMISHAAAAISGYREAIRLGQLPGAAPAPAPATGPFGVQTVPPRDGRAQLGLATVLDQFADWKLGRQLPSTLKPLPRPTNAPAMLEGGAFLPSVTIEELRRIDHGQARDAYLYAFRTAFPGESRLSNQPVQGLPSLVSYEAGFAFLRLAAKEPDASRDGTELSKAVAEVKAGLDKVGRIPRGAVTPIIFALRPADSIQQLLAPNVIVDFDLRGYGPADCWPWVQPETGILVWDPLQRGRIDSARQLFGGYTFEIFRKDGYASLAALDDNRDGLLSGAELDGIRAWFDSNRDGRSEAAEVKDLSELGIAAIDVRATSSEGPHATNPNGLLLRDGKRLPTWDWTVEPIPH